jgi:hypothetical protein
MPTSGTATYNLMGYTNPTATDGSTGYTVNGTLNVTFGALTAPTTVGVNMTVANSSANTIPLIGTISTPAGIATFGGSVSSLGTGCINSCSTSINGFFAGTNASRAGLSYSITGATAGSIQGVAAFAKN